MTDYGRIGLIGLGAIGGPVTEALLDAGHELVICDERSDATAPFSARAVTVCATPVEVARMADTVLVSLPTPEVVRVVACGEHGLIHGGTMRTFVDLSTTGTVVATEIACTLADAGVAYVDAPVSGGVAGAVARSLTVMTSGEATAVERVRPILATFAGHIFYIGPIPGQGQLAKVLNNLLSATAIAITSEVLTFGVSAGLDAATLLDVFNVSSGRNTATADKFPKHVLTRSFGSGFRLELMAKDVELCLAEARSRHVAMPLGGLVQQLWTLAAAQAGERDHTEIVRLFEAWAGVTVVQSAEPSPHTR